MPGNPAGQANRELAACPHIDASDVPGLAEQGIEDALDLIVDVHDLDPRQIYGRLVLWGRENPARLVTACVALAAMHNPNTSARELERNLRANHELWKGQAA